MNTNASGREQVVELLDMVLSGIPLPDDAPRIQHIIYKSLELGLHEDFPRFFEKVVMPLLPKHTKQGTPEHADLTPTEAAALMDELTASDKHFTELQNGGLTRVPSNAITVDG